MNKILMIACMPFYKEKGSSLRVYSMLEMLSKKYEIDLVTYSLGTDVVVDNVNIIRTTGFYKPKVAVSKPTISKVILDFFVLLKSIRQIFKNKYAIIHCEDFEAAFVGFLLKILNGNKLKLIYNLHNRIGDNLNISSKSTKLSFFKKITLKFEDKIIKKSDKIICNWDMYYQDQIFKNKSKFLFYDKIDLNIEEYKIPYEKYLIYSGNFEDYQGIFEFLSVYKSANNTLPLILVGEITEKLKFYIKENNLSKKVFTTGRLSINQTNYLIKKSVAGILPRKYGIQPSMKMIHYLIFEKPVIATDIECNKELLVNNNNSYLYANNDELLTIFENCCKQNFFESLKKGILETKTKITEIWDEEYFIENYNIL